MQSRQIAHIARIKDINDGNFVKEDGWNPSYVKIGSKNVARINIIGAIIELADGGNSRNIVLDDGTGKISVRNFENKIDAKIGDVVLLIGRIRQFGNDKYIVPEIVKKDVNVKWSAVWKKTSIKADKAGFEKDYAGEKETAIDENPEHIPNDIMSKIRDLDDGTGVSYNDAVRNQGDEKVISSLLLRGDIFEIKPGRLKVLD